MVIKFSIARGTVYGLVRYGAWKDVPQWLHDFAARMYWKEWK